MTRTAARSLSRSTTDRDAARASLQQLLAWQPARIILAHGRWYAENAEAELRRAFRWLDKGG